jgi:hypothetical protein
MISSWAMSGKSRKKENNDQAVDSVHINKLKEIPCENLPCGIILQTAAVPYCFKRIKIPPS